jgi:hypothetical protein
MLRSVFPGATTLRRCFLLGDVQYIIRLYWSVERLTNLAQSSHEACHVQSDLVNLICVQSGTLKIGIARPMTPSNRSLPDSEFPHN